MSSCEVNKTGQTQVQRVERALLSRSCAFLFKPIAVLFIAALASFAQAGTGLQPVTLQLNWKHQFQFAGYYAAIDRGYYREADFDVRVQELQDGRDPIDAVLAGAAQYGVGASELALRRGKGQPVVVLATILQHSPLVLIAAGRGEASIHELVGKKIMMVPHETELIAYLQREGVPLDRIVQVPHSFNPDDVLKGRVAAASGYSTDEPYLLKKAGMPFTLYSPRASGIDFYGDSLFTTQMQVRAHPERVAAFLNASLRGWQYAMDHPAEIADLILARYGQRKSRQHLLFEAEEMRRLMQPQLVEIGYMNPGRWEHVAATYAELGMLPASYSLDGFLFQPARRTDWALVYRIGAIVALVLLIAGVMVVVLIRFNLRMSREVTERIGAHAALQEVNVELQQRLDEVHALQKQLREQVMRDPLTGMYNRRFLDDALQTEIARAVREREPMSLMMLDIDHFKRVNDSHGHQAGDEVLKMLAGILRGEARRTDVACRYGGEEFVLLLPKMNIESARARAERWRQMFAEMDVPVESGQLRCTLSVGIAVFPEHGNSAEDLLRNGDRALYLAKALGRNRVVTYDMGQQEDAQTQIR